MSLFDDQAQGSFPSSLGQIGPLAAALQWLNTHGVDGLMNGRAYASTDPSGPGRPQPPPSPGPFEPESRVPRTPPPFPPEPVVKSVFLW
jgi:hypothetical protein